jgi:hypothetical protein
MQIILLPNGQSLTSPETLTLKDNKLPFRFVGAPAYSTLQIICNNQITRRTLSSSGETTIDIPQTSDNIRFKVISPERVWICDGIHVERDVFGYAHVTSIVDYSGSIAEMYNELSAMKAEISSLRTEIESLKEAEPYKFV